MEPNVAGIYIINLDSRPERWKLFLKGVSLWKSAFGKIPEHFPAVAGVTLAGYDQKPWFTGRISERRKKSWGGKAGAILSHRNAIKKAFDQKLDNVLIVEDDAFLTDEMASAWKNGLNQLVTNLSEPWAVVNFCTTKPISPCRVITECQEIKLVEAVGAFGAVAYLLNGRIFRQLLKELPDETAIWQWVARHKTIDRWFSQNLVRFGKVYLFAPSIIGHREGPSDITMTPESDWDFDFALKNIPLVRNLVVFSVSKKIRRINNAFHNFFSIFRLMAKRIRGL